MIKIYTGPTAAALPLFFLAGLILIFSVVFWGFTKAIGLLFPLLVIGAYLLVIIFVLGVLPAGYFKDLRPKAAVYSLVMSQLLGTIAWMVSFLFVVKAFGLIGFLLAFLLQLLAPVAMVGAALQGSWRLAGHLIVWISFSYIMKFYSLWLLAAAAPRKKQGNIIDVEAEEVEG